MSTTPKASRSVRWAARLFAVTAIPLLILAGGEMTLRLLRVGHDTSFFVRDGDVVRTNPRFGWRFFGPRLSRPPLPLEFARHKPEGTVRVFLLGGSAARGFPNPAFGLSAMLRAMLEDQYPGVRFEVINTGMTAINSHVVREILDDCLDLQPDLFVVYLGNNEVVGPFGAGTVFGAGPRDARAIRAGLWVQSTRTGQLLARLRRGLSGVDDAPRDWGGMEMFLEQKVASSEPGLQTVYANFEANLRAMASAADRRQVPIVFSTVLANLVDQPPFYSVEDDLSVEAHERWLRAREEGEALAAEGQWEQAEARFAEAVQIDPGHAWSHWGLAQSLAALGKMPEAGPQFEAALELDALRFRADARINEILRGTATWPSVTLADPWAGRATLPGRDVLYEHVHLNFAGTYAVARAILVEIEPLLPAKTQARRVATPVEDAAHYVRRIGFDAFAEMMVEQQIAAITARPPFGPGAATVHRERAAAVAASLDVAALQASAAATAQDLARDPGDFARRTQYAELLAFLGRPLDALEQIRWLRQRVPGELSWRLREAELCSALGRHDEAVALLQALVRDDPNFAEAQPALAAALLAAGDRDAARSAYLDVTRLHPRNADAHYQLGKMAFEDEDYEQARAQLREATTMDPAHPEAWYLRGRLLDRENRLEPALVAYARSMEALGGQAPVYYYTARVYFRLGAIESARRVYRQAVAFDPRFGRPPYRLAEAIERDDAAAGTLAQLERMVAASPDDARLRFTLGLAYAIASRPDRARVEVQRAVELDADLEEAWHELAVLGVADSTVSAQDVVTWAERACQLSAGDDASRYDTLAQARARAGDREGALDAAREGLAIARRWGPREQVERLLARILSLHGTRARS